MQTLAQAAARLASGTSSRALVEECLERIADPAGEGARVFLRVNGEGAREDADHVDRLRRRGAAPSPLAGIPISVKDLFDVAGEVTTAASMVLRETAPATRDAVAIARLRAAGLILIGRTNMTEFAFSGLGVNPHYPAPRNPYDRATGRIPGGSSSGAAVSVTDGMALGAIGTDTGGSCRIPAALCGIAGFKPTARRIPLAGTLPLSPTLDSIGPLAPTVACCAALDAVMAGERPSELTAFPVAGLRLAVPRTMVLDGMDEPVARAFSAALTAVSRAGARIVEIPLTELGALARVNRKGGFACAESYAFHHPLIAARAAQYDPRVLERVLRGKEQDAADYIALIRARSEIIAALAPITAPYDALVMPTTPIIAPTFDEVADAESYHRINLLVLRNPSLVNALDRCAVSIPCHRGGEAPVGLMLVGEHGADRRLLSIAAAIEKLVLPLLSGIRQM